MEVSRFKFAIVEPLKKDSKMELQKRLYKSRLLWPDAASNQYGRRREEKNREEKTKGEEEKGREQTRREETRREEKRREDNMRGI